MEEYWLEKISNMESGAHAEETLKEDDMHEILLNAKNQQDLLLKTTENL